MFFPDPDFLPFLIRDPKKYCRRSGMFVPDPGFEFFPSRIPDPHQRIQLVQPQNCFQALGYTIRASHPGSVCRIRILTFYTSRIQGTKRLLDPGCGSCNKCLFAVLLIQVHRIHMFLGLPDPDPTIIMQK
jgi:hypothetical protein